MEDKEIKPYGYELILDLHGCDISKFNRMDIRTYFIEICKKIDMERVALHFWDEIDLTPEERATEPHLVGISAVQFIKTSSIVIHALSLKKTVHLNIFSCKIFDEKVAKKFSENYFKGEVSTRYFLHRF